MNQMEHKLPLVAQGLNQWRIGTVRCFDARICCAFLVLVIAVFAVDASAQQHTDLAKRIEKISYDYARSIDQDNLGVDEYRAIKDRRRVNLDRLCGKVVQSKTLPTAFDDKVAFFTAMETLERHLEIVNYLKGTDSENPSDKVMVGFLVRGLLMTSQLDEAVALMENLRQSNPQAYHEFAVYHAVIAEVFYRKQMHTRSLVHLVKYLETQVELLKTDPAIGKTFSRTLRRLVDRGALSNPILKQAINECFFRLQNNACQSSVLMSKADDGRRIREIEDADATDRVQRASQKFLQDEKIPGENSDQINDEELAKTMSYLHAIAAFHVALGVENLEQKQLQYLDTLLAIAIETNRDFVVAELVFCGNEIVRNSNLWKRHGPLVSGIEKIVKSNGDSKFRQLFIAIHSNICNKKVK